MKFQFLSRNSVRWDPLGFALLNFQQNSFQFLSRNSVRWDIDILSPLFTCLPLFQFLSRNSVRWDQARSLALRIRYLVSIPQSEFCPLGRPQRAGDNWLRVSVSIPQSEFCPLGHSTTRWIVARDGVFQFLSRNSVRWD